VVFGTEIHHNQVRRPPELCYFLSNLPWRFQTCPHQKLFWFSCSREWIFRDCTYSISINLNLIRKFFVIRFKNPFLGTSWRIEVIPFTKTLFFVFYISGERFVSKGQIFISIMYEGWCAYRFNNVILEVILTKNVLVSNMHG
jgi:hypothetical protein